MGHVSNSYDVCVLLCVLFPVLRVRSSPDGLLGVKEAKITEDYWRLTIELSLNKGVYHDDNYYCYYTESFKYCHIIYVQEERSVKHITRLLSNDVSPGNVIFHALRKYIFFLFLFNQISSDSFSSSLYNPLISLFPKTLK